MGYVYKNIYICALASVIAFYISNEEERRLGITCLDGEFLKKDGEFLRKRTRIVDNFYRPIETTSFKLNSWSV